ncbi:MAG: hypothetical protein Q7J32_09065 [Sphingomonadaceae bacterium]|nr:hypothetical protein [Sphingomonadaceae bacterium]
MFIALVGNDGFIEMIGPHSILRVAPLAAGSVVTLDDGRRLSTQDDIATLRRRVRAVSPSSPGRNRLLRRLWVTGMWHATRNRLRLPLRRAAG